MKITFSLLLVALTISASAQSVTISGQVMDDQNYPLYGVNIYVPGTQVGTTTDFDGNFQLEVAKDVEKLQFSYLGFEDEEVTLGGVNQTLAINLNPATIGLQQVVVSASKRKERILDAPASVTMLGTEKLEQSVALTSIDHLKKTPGVHIMQTGLVSSNVAVRGFNDIFQGDMLTMVDYRIGRVPSLRVNAYQMIPSSPLDIERMELVRGPGSALYGPNAADGVLHIITKSPLDMEDKFEATVSMRAGARSRNLDLETKSAKVWITGPELRLSGKVGDWFGYKLSGSYLRANDWKSFDNREPDAGDALIFGNVLNGQTFQPDTTGVFDFDDDGQIDSVALATGVFEKDFDIEKLAGDARFDFQINPDISLVLSGGITRNSNIELTGLGAAQALKWTYTYGQARFRWKDLFFQYFINSSDAGDTYLIPQVGDNDPPHNIQRLVDKSKLHALQIQHSTDKIKRLGLIYGFDALMTRPVTEGSINGRFEDEDAINQIGGYIQAEYDAHEKVTLVGAARVDYQSPIKETVVSPRAAIVYKPKPRHTLRGTYNRAFSSPTSLQLFLDISNGTHPVHGFNFRGIGNPNGYDYRFSNDDGLPQFINLWTYDPSNPQNVQYINFSDQSMNAVFFERLKGVMAAVFIDMAPDLAGVIPGLIDAMFVGIDGSSGTITNANLAAFNFINLLETGDPVASLWRGTGDVSTIGKLPVVESPITQTVELGYKGIIADKFFVTVDAYWTRITNFSSPLTVASPTIGFHPLDLAAAFGDPLAPGEILHDNIALMEPVIGSLLDQSATGNNNGTSADEVADIMQQLNSQVPSGVITPEDDKVNTDVILTYVNLGTVDVFGGDIGLTYQINPNISVSGSFSIVDKDSIPLEGAAEGYAALNAPRHKTAWSFEHKIPSVGFSYGLNWRWQDSYPGNADIYIGPVEAAHFVDLTLGYRPNWSKNTLLSLDITNLLDNDWQPFPGTPVMGIMVMGRVSHTFRVKQK